MKHDANSQDFEGEVIGVRSGSHGGDWKVVKLKHVLSRGALTIVGEFPQIAVGDRLRVSGQMTSHPKFGEQLKMTEFQILDPSGREAITAYLSSDHFPGVGPGKAKNIVDHFGVRVLETLDESPEKVREVKGFKTKLGDIFIEAYRESRLQRELMVHLRKIGESSSLSKKIFEKYGGEAIDVLRRRPYQLSLEINGIGFKTADRLARSQGLDPLDPLRAEAASYAMLRKYSEGGHLYTERSRLATDAQELLSDGELEVDLSFAESGVERLLENLRAIETEEGIALKHLARAEEECIECLTVLLKSPGAPLGSAETAIAQFEKEQGVELAKAQRESVLAVAEHKALIVTGGPGVGKTTVIRAILSVLRSAGLNTSLAAPTGRAAKRMAEAAGVPAFTIHRLLEVEPHRGKFVRCAENPLDCDALIIDEASMLDIRLARDLLVALPSRARLIMVGDADQLPSVGPGAMLRDLIDSKVFPTVRLTEVFRQDAASPITLNAHAILRGESPVSSGADDPKPEFFYIKCQDAERAAELIEQMVCERIPQRFGFDPLKDVQVLTPMHRGASGTIELNRRLQKRLNSEIALRQGDSRENGFATGDRVIQLRNDYDKEIFNGDLGRVISRHGDKLEVDFDGKVVSYAASDSDQLTLAYATTIHKSQGSEYPVVVLPMLKSHYMMLSRNLLYTAVTRARKLCILVADPKAIEIALGETRKEARRTALSRRLRASLR